MSCNGCRVLRKGCSETCVLRPCLQWIESAEAQGHATVFVAKFFGRAGLMSFITAVPENKRPSLFQSLLYEAAGRTVNPVNGAVGLLGTGNWHVCQAAVETILRGGVLKPITEFLPDDVTSDCTNMFGINDMGLSSCPKVAKRRHSCDELADLNLSLSLSPFPETRRVGSPSMNSEESVTTNCGGYHYQPANERKLLNLFN